MAAAQAVGGSSPAGTTRESGPGTLTVVPTAGSTTTARVTKIVDGDTIRTTKGTLRLVGIDTPERGRCSAASDGQDPHAGALIECLGRQDAGPWRDPNLHFYRLSAAAMLLVALQRTALERPEALAPQPVWRRGIAREVAPLTTSWRCPSGAATPERTSCGTLIMTRTHQRRRGWGL